MGERGSAARLARPAATAGAAARWEEMLAKGAGALAGQAVLGLPGAAGPVPGEVRGGGLPVHAAAWQSAYSADSTARAQVNTHACP
jgi:hypothetical protein